MEAGHTERQVFACSSVMCDTEYARLRSQWYRGHCATIITRAASALGPPQCARVLGTSSVDNHICVPVDPSEVGSCRDPNFTKRPNLRKHILRGAASPEPRKKFQLGTS